MGLRGFIVKRVAYSFVLLLLVICVNFVIFMLMPGDPTQFLIPMDPSGGIQTEHERQERIQLLQDRWGLGDAMPIKLLKYIRNLLSWEFGVSFFYKTDVSKVMNWRIPYTLFLIGGATVISVIIGVLWGVQVIQRRGGFFDSGSVVGSLILGSLPTFWIGLIFLLVFYVMLHWFPNAGAFPREWAGGNWPIAFTSGSSLSSTSLNVFLSINPQEAIRLVWGHIHHVFLPMVTLVLFSFGGWLIFTRATMLDVVTEDYINTARAKGLDERAVMYKHALKNAALPLVTSAALAFGFVLGGAMITEAVYTYPGLGRFTFDAITYHDYSILMAFFYIISICVIVANIMADLLYGILDPRIRFGG